MKGFFKRLAPKIVPELKYFFLRALPIAFIFLWIFVMSPLFGNNSSIGKEGWSLYGFGLLLSLIGVYIARFTAWVIWKVITAQYDVIPDIYCDDKEYLNSKNNQH